MVRLRNDGKFMQHADPFSFETFSGGTCSFILTASQRKLFIEYATFYAASTNAEAVISVSSVRKWSMDLGSAGVARTFKVNVQGGVSTDQKISCFLNASTTGHIALAGWQATL